MNCPICGSKAEQGGLMAESLFINWVPQEELKRNYLKEFVRLTFPGVTISTNPPLLKRAKVPNAYYCPQCKKVFGIFDVTDDGNRL